MLAILVVYASWLGSPAAHAENTSEPVRFDCTDYLVSTEVAYADLITGIPDPSAWKLMEGDLFYAHARSYSSPVAISANGQFYSGWHRRDHARVDVRETATGELAHMFRLPPGYSIEELSPDGRRVLAVNLPPRAKGPRYSHLLVIDTATSDVVLDLSSPPGFNELNYAWVSAEVVRVHFADGTRLYRFDGEGPGQLIERLPPASSANVLRYDLPTPTLDERVRVSLRGFGPPARRVGHEWQPFVWRPTTPLAAGKRAHRVTASMARPKYNVDYRVSPSGKFMALRGHHGFSDPVTGGNFESFVDLFDVRGGRLIKRFFVPSRVVSSLAFSPDETELAWAGADVLEVVEIASERKIFSDVREDVDLTALVTDLAFVDAQKLILYDGHARLRTVRVRP